MPGQTWLQPLRSWRLKHSPGGEGETLLTQSLTFCTACTEWRMVQQRHSQAAEISNVAGNRRELVIKRPTGCPARTGITVCPRGVMVLRAKLQCESTWEPQSEARQTNGYDDLEADLDLMRTKILMRTTLELPDPLFARLKARGARARSRGSMAA